MGYDVILVDYPWDFEVWNRDTGNGRSASAHYQTQGIEWGLSLPVNDLANKNCALFFWAVWPRIFDAKLFFDAWGFTYKTLAFEWVKLNRSGIGFHLGMGYYTRANPEPCLLAVKGNMPVAVHGERNLLVEFDDDWQPELAGLPMARQFRPAGLELPLVSPVREHSQKPDEQYQKIERLYPIDQYPNRLELFARQRWPGWYAWGNQVPGGSDIEISMDVGKNAITASNSF